MSTIIKGPNVSVRVYRTYEIREFIDIPFRAHQPGESDDAYVDAADKIAQHEADQPRYMTGAGYQENGKGPFVQEYNSASDVRLVIGEQLIDLDEYEG